MQKHFQTVPTSSNYRSTHQIQELMFRAFRYMNLFSVGEMNNLIHALDEVKLEPRYFITGQCLSNG